MCMYVCIYIYIYYTYKTYLFDYKQLLLNRNEVGQIMVLWQFVLCNR